MSDIAALGNGIAVHSLKSLTGLNPVKLPPEEATRLQAQLKEIQELRYRVPSGPADEIYAGYRKLTGVTPLPPKAAFR